MRQSFDENFPQFAQEIIMILRKKTHYECVFVLNAHIVEVFLVCLPRNICFVNCFCKDCCSTFACVQKHFACDYKHCMRQFGCVQNYEIYCLKLCSKVSRSMWHKQCPEVCSIVSRTMQPSVQKHVALHNVYFVKYIFPRNRTSSDLS